MSLAFGGRVEAWEGWGGAEAGEAAVVWVRAKRREGGGDGKVHCWFG